MDAENVPFPHSTTPHPPHPPRPESANCVYFGLLEHANNTIYPSCVALAIFFPFQFGSELTALGLVSGRVDPTTPPLSESKWCRPQLLSRPAQMVPKHCHASYLTRCSLFSFLFLVWRSSWVRFVVVPFLLLFLPSVRTRHPPSPYRRPDRGSNTIHLWYFYQLSAISDGLKEHLDGCGVAF